MSYLDLRTIRHLRHEDKLPRSPVPPTYQKNPGPLRCTTPCRRLSASRLVSRRLSTPRVKHPRNRRRPSAHRLGTGSRQYQERYLLRGSTHAPGRDCGNMLIGEREAGKLGKKICKGALCRNKQNKTYNM